MAGRAGSRQGAVSTPAHWADKLGRCFSPRACLLPWVSHGFTSQDPGWGMCTVILVLLPDGCIQASDGAGLQAPPNVLSPAPRSVWKSLDTCAFSPPVPCVAEGASELVRVPQPSTPGAWALLTQHVVVCTLPSPPMSPPSLLPWAAKLLGGASHTLHLSCPSSFHLSAARGNP